MRICAASLFRSFAALVGFWMCLFSYKKSYAAQRLFVGVPAQQNTITAKAGTSSLYSFLGGMLEWEFSFSRRAGVFANYQANISNNVVVLNGPEAGLRYFLWGELPDSAQGVLGTFKSVSPFSLSLQAGLGHRDYNFSQLEATQGDEVIRSRTLTSGSFLQPSAGLQAEIMLPTNAIFFVRIKYGKAVFYETKPISISSIDIIMGVGLPL